MQSLAQPRKASGATTAATAAAREPEGSVRGARAASQAAARAPSAATSMSAQRCFTAWNCPMGRPNCSRTLAWDAAVSTHQPAPPAHSAAMRTAASPATCSVAAGVSRSSGPTSAPRARTSASPRVPSRASSASTSRSATRTTHHTSPSALEAGTTATSASVPPRTGRTEPSSRRVTPPSSPASTGSALMDPAPKASVPKIEPAASPGRSWARSLSPPQVAMAAPARTVGRKGPGTQARPSSSRTTASSGNP